MKALSYKKKLLGLNIIIVGILYLFTQHYCSGECYVDFERPFLGPLYYLMTGLLPSMLYLQFFDDQISLMWVKSIAWWFLIVSFGVVSTVKFGQGLFPMTSDGRSDTAVLMMIVLFAVTLVYAPVMSKKPR